MRWWPSPCKKGDIVRVRIGSVYHYGIFVSESEVIQFGPPPVSLGSFSDHKVIASNIESFSCGNIVEVASPETAQERRRYSVGKTVRLARARIGEGGYDLIHNNCEHFVYECTYGEHRSTQTDDVRRRWYNRPLLNVYILPIEGFSPSGTVYPAMRAAYNEAGSAELRLLRTAAWQALEQGIAHSYSRSMDELDFSLDERGKWQCAQYGISITHTRSFVAAAVSNAPVGIDMECAEDFAARHGAALDSLIKTSCMPGELESSLTEESFLRMWTRKEAIFKCRGTGLFNPSLTDSRSGDTLSVSLKQGSDFILSVCGERAQSLCCYMLGGEQPCRINTEKI